MKKSVAMKWVADLRSGKYKQGQGVLKSEKGEYCCLGVLCETLNFKFDKNNMIDGKFNTLTERVLKKAGMRRNNFGGEIKSLNESLWSLNDNGGPELEPLTFDEIADIIEINYKEL